LKHFPYEIQHTIQWARSHFEDLFTNPAEKVNKYLADPRGFLAKLETMHPGERIQDLKIVKNALIDERPQNSEDCVKWARKLFQSNYHNAIGQLLHNFPADQQTSSGSKFWSGTKRCPHTLTFDPSNQFHFDFVYAAAILRAEQYSLKPILDRQICAEIATNYQPEPFVPRANVRIASTEAEAANEQNEEDRKYIR
jgi:ubiquitin-activating enzyme E1